MNVLEKKYTIELTESELHILQTAMCNRNQLLSEKLVAAEAVDESLFKSEQQVEVHKRYKERLERKLAACEQLMNSLFNAEMRGEYDDD